MSKTDTFSNSIDLALINEYDKDTLIQISTGLVDFYNVAFWRVLWNGTFQTFIWLRFRSPQFPKDKIYDSHLFFQNI